MLKTITNPENTIVEKKRCCDKCGTKIYLSKNVNENNAILDFVNCNLLFTKKSVTLSEENDADYDGIFGEFCNTCRNEIVRILKSNGVTFTKIRFTK